MPSADPTTRRLVARVAASTRWAHESDRTRATTKARDGLERRFEREVDPEGRLNPDERARRVASARAAYFARLSLASAQARRARRGAA